MNAKQLNGVWVHEKTGNTYSVLSVANSEAEVKRRNEYPPTVVYEREGSMWSRPLSNFLESFRPVDVPHRVNEATVTAGDIKTASDSLDSMREMFLLQNGWNVDDNLWSKEEASMLTDVEAFDRGDYLIMENNFYTFTVLVNGSVCGEGHGIGTCMVNALESGVKQGTVVLPPNQEVEVVGCTPDGLQLRIDVCKGLNV